MKREDAEATWRKKFADLELSKQFEFIGRDWQTDHGRKAFVKCKACGSTFDTWGVSEVFRGRQSALLCPSCGVASSGSGVFARTEKAREAAELYLQGLEQVQIAEKLGCTTNEVGTATKKYKVVDPKRKTRGVQKANNRRHVEAMALWDKMLEADTLPEIKNGDHNKRRAARFRCRYDATVTLTRLIERDGLRCALCGGECDPADHKQGQSVGPTYPSIDHIVPMSKGGGHTWDNVQIAHIKCNRQKSDKVVAL